MGVITYSIKKYGKDYKLSENFRLGEFQCKNGADEVKVSTELITYLERLRAYVGGSISINSGYRTAAYNKSIGGASLSQHVVGTAADIVVKDHNGNVIDGRLICCLCQDLGFKGIAWISYRATHVDMRASGIYRGTESKGYGNNVGGNFYTYFGLTRAAVEKLKYVVEIPESKPVIPVDDKKEDKEEEMVYKTIQDVPSWGKAAVKLRVDHGWTDGKNVTDSMLRVWVIEDREDPYIANNSDLPAWAIRETEELQKSGKLKGTEKESIGMRLSILRACIIANRK